jgi:hypothetical protein
MSPKFDRPNFAFTVCELWQSRTAAAWIDLLVQHMLHPNASIKLHFAKFFNHPRSQNVGHGNMDQA